MKTFEVAISSKNCKKIKIEPSDEFGELMLVFKFPLNCVFLRGLIEDMKHEI